MSGGLIFAGVVTAGALIGGYLYSREKSDSASDSTPVTTALNPNEFVPFKVSEIERISPNTSIIRFNLQENQVSGINVASCVLTMIPPTKEGEEPIIRPYTPITDEHTKGHMDFIIKEYQQGVMSKHICNLKVGDDLLIKGPLRKYKYEPSAKKEIGMIAGGTGITPMLQVIHKVVRNPEDTTKLKLLFANVTEEDILLKEHLDMIVKEHPDKLEIHYVLDKPPKGWTGETGYISEDMVKKYMPNPELGDDCVMFVCGPPGLMKVVSGGKKSKTDQGPLSGILKQLGYTESNVFKF
ncbi:hypothetical protein BB559_001103 [Furculomyces boomerangus]|uniref:NADH-cytochrome b5 reductase n=2 Tax=Harpellales TaxID=61421 RepID=A0A2T9XZ95_9FUNG|nr:hypothetical protein BB559_007064 [Furculomyces boomerangus]PVU98998.1 hypothetical protein BB559_001103 [Furculomyces boomerangus]PVZ97784.1 hypothetical protein BB558_006255 [Smittium angustum]